MASELKTEFLEVFPNLLQEVITEIEQMYPDYDKDCLVWLNKVMEYNCVGGKMNRGMSVLNTYKRLIAPREPTQEETKEANTLGWMIEWLQAFFLVSDDIMDKSEMRRGQPCWYLAKDPPYRGWKGEQVGMVAINDAFIIESAIYKILKKHFRSKPYYVDLLELFHETTWQTELGQALDLLTAPDFDVDITKFTIEKYKCIVKYKTAFYSFYLPVALGMMMAGFSPETDKTMFDGALDILLEMGELFQIQDDYLDCFGDPEKIGKVGTDIQDNKCGWLIVKAMELSTEEQKEILRQNYAKHDPVKIEKVKQVYRELNLPDVYREYEARSYERLQGLIKDKAGRLPAEIFTDFAKKIYGRTV